MKLPVLLRVAADLHTGAEDAEVTVFPRPRVLEMEAVCHCRVLRGLRQKIVVATQNG